MLARFMCCFPALFLTSFEQEFSDPRDADDARYNLDGRDVDGSRLIVEFAKGVGILPFEAYQYQFFIGYFSLIISFIINYQCDLSFGAILLVNACL